MTGCRHRLIAACIVALCGPAALAQSADEDLERPVSEGGTYSATFENDIFGGTDRNYTNGVRIGYLSERNALPLWGRWARAGLGWLSDADDWYVSYAVGQNIYTPEDISLPEPPPGARPYAGFLYASFGVVADTGDQLDTVALEVGIVGESSLAEEVQSTVHEVIGAEDPRGWDTQVRDEPAFRLLWERKYRFLYDFDPGIFGLQVDAAPHLAVALGNVDTSVQAGATVRIGDRLDDTYGPPRIRPAVSGPGFFDGSDGFGWYLYGSAAARAVGYNMFLQGNAFRDGVDGVAPNRVVADVQAGVALQFSRVELTYTHVFRTEEFAGQDGFAQFGSINARLRF